MPININDLCKMIKDFDAVILAYEEEKENTLKNELKKLNKNESINIGVIIGPEGGIDKSEIEKLANAGAKVVTLGKRILRTETASLNIISNIMYEYEMQEDKINGYTKRKNNEEEVKNKKAQRKRRKK